MFFNKNLRAANKTFINLLIKFDVFLHFLPFLLRGKFSVKYYILFLKRMLFFLSKLQHNKFMKIDKKIRLGLYIPGWPSKAFYQACTKFTTFKQKLPCTTVLVSLTSACRYKCEHCYQKNDIGKDLHIDKLIPVIKKLQDDGIAFFNVEGGEPFLVFDKLKKICAAIDNRSEIWINSTGDGMSIERLEELKKLNVNAILFSMHSPIPEELNKFTRVNSALDNLLNGINLCH